MKDILNPWVIAGAVLTASLLILISFFASGTLFSGNQNSYSGDAVLTVIPVPTYTMTPLPTEPEITPTIEPMIDIQVGTNVQIKGTDGEGLRLRRDPSLTGEIVYLGLEGEIFLISGGPQEQDGYIWWQLVAPLNESRTGWAVSNFLQPAQSP
jgi:hypothetical protein